MKLIKNLSRQGRVALIGYMLLVVALLLPVKKSNDTQDYNLGGRVTSILIMILPMIISVYTINCMVVGVKNGGLPCTVLAWLNSASVFIWSSLILLFTVVLLVNGTSKNTYLKTSGNSV
jgi:hypothetical protein